MPNHFDWFHTRGTLGLIATHSLHLYLAAKSMHAYSDAYEQAAITWNGALSPDDFGAYIELFTGDLLNRTRDILDQAKADIENSTQTDAKKALFLARIRFQNMQLQTRASMWASTLIALSRTAPFGALTIALMRF